MRRGKVTKELLAKMIAARQSGKTYSEIEAEYGIGRWTTLHYLKNVEPKCAPVIAWKDAEREAVKEFVRRGFKVLLNLNDVCASPSWDYCVEKDGEQWLIDVTINKFKSVVDKSHRMVDGYRCAVLYTSNNKWELMEITTTKID